MVEENNRIYEEKQEASRKKTEDYLLKLQEDSKKLAEQKVQKAKEYAQKVKEGKKPKGRAPTGWEKYMNDNSTSAQKKYNTRSNKNKNEEIKLGQIPELSKNFKF